MSVEAATPLPDETATPYQVMLDSVNPHAFTGLKFDALAGYVGGSWPDFSTECQLYPGLAKAHRILSVAVNATEQAECLDVETGDARPGEAGPWAKAAIARGVWRPVLYANASTMPAVRASIAAAGLATKDVRLWLAHYTYHPGVEAGYDGTQWSDHYENRNIDGSSILDDFFAPKPQPHHFNPPHYDWFDPGPFPSPHWGQLNERSVVERYDHLRTNPQKHHVELMLRQAQCAFLARRVAFVAEHLHPLANHHPSWGQDHRGWRRLVLERRSHGVRFV